MKKIIFLITFTIVIRSFGIVAGNLSISQLVKLAQSTSISNISELANNNGYKMAYKRDKARGWEGYDVTDMAWAYNAEYLEASNAWISLSEFSVIKVLVNNATHKFERIDFLLSNSSGNYFITLKNQIANYGFKFLCENTEVIPDAIIYCFYNDNLNLSVYFIEYSTNKPFQISFMEGGA